MKHFNKVIKKILLIDDDKKLCELLYSYLISYNFSVEFVHSIRSALVVIKKRKPDLVISDIMMHDLNGYDFIKLLNLNYHPKSIPVIFLTAKGMTHDRIRGYNLGCYAYLIKPFDPQELVAIINSILSHVELFTKIDQTAILSLKSNSSLYSQGFLKSFNFTNREKTVLNFILKGYMNKEIAIVLNVTQRNVEKYVTRLFIKTNVRNRIELIRLFI
uniref:TctD-like protein n=1 Tax=Tolypiocladia glomerulata TaxID=860646 RepID=A0A1Z1MUP0_9FLOR|nr:hypothetical protein [Tolypiocladia glomerulata]ARW69830.1 hypothetical protein [Tolypiocladia glomerulata]